MTDGKTRPDATGHFDQFGGRFVPETLMPALIELEKHYVEVASDPDFHRELAYYLGRRTLPSVSAGSACLLCC